MAEAPPVRIDRQGVVYEQLRSLIIRGRLAAGTRVVEADIAERLGVSRTPAREAIRQLFQEGFLTSTGAARRTELAVAPLTGDDMFDLYRIMSALEGSAALSIGTLELPVRRQLARDLKEAETLFERAGGERTVDYDRLFELHNAFHERLVDACASPRLRGLIETVRPLVDRYEWVYAPLVGPDYRETFAEHDAIIRAVREGPGTKVQRAVSLNWENGAKRLARVIEKAGARGDW